MRHLFFTILFSLITMCVTTASAQSMNIKQCIEYALKNNLSYANQQIQSKINNEMYRQSKRDFLPDISAGSSANKRYGRSIDPTTNTFVDQNFFSMNFYLDSQIDLFRGFTKINNVKFQQLHYLMSRENIKQKEIEIAFGVMNSYYDVLYFSNLRNIVKEQMQLSELNVTKTKKLIELGLKAESDLLEMKAQQASESHNFILAENQRDHAVLVLKKWMNYPLTDELQIENETLLMTQDTLFNPNDVYKVAMQHIPTIQLANLEVEASRKSLAIARGELAPRLTLGAGLSTNYADSRKERLDPNDPTNQAMHTIPFNSQWSQNMAKSIYLNLQIPIFNRWNGQSKIKRAKLEQQMALNKQKEEQLNLYQLISEDLQQLKALHNEASQLQAKKEALQEAYTISEKKLEQGLITVIEFYTAKNQLAQAQADWMRTLLQLKVKEKTIHFYLAGSPL